MSRHTDNFLTLWLIYGFTHCFGTLYMAWKIHVNRQEWTKSEWFVCFVTQIVDHFCHWWITCDQPMRFEKLSWFTQSQLCPQQHNFFLLFMSKLLVCLVCFDFTINIYRNWLNVYISLFLVSVQMRCSLANKLLHIPAPQSNKKRKKVKENKKQLECTHALPHCKIRLSARRLVR